ncbi:hypothetical protein ACYULU_02640 [Breznakiellaceae bacterium SP9]
MDNLKVATIWAFVLFVPEFCWQQEQGTARGAAETDGGRRGTGEEI